MPKTTRKDLELVLMNNGYIESSPGIWYNPRVGTVKVFEENKKLVLDTRLGDFYIPIQSAEK